jgi:hypothetical protein
MSNRTEAAPRKLSQEPPGDYGHCACSRLHIKMESHKKGKSRVAVPEPVQ